MTTRRGFTLIEVLIVITILGVLTTIVLVNLNQGRVKARDARRLSDLQQVQSAVELYAEANGGKYPCSGIGGSCSNIRWLGTCAIDQPWGTGSQGTTGANAWVPDVAPAYISELPVDPRPSTNLCYLYYSDGTNYSLLAHGTVESHPTAATNPNPRLLGDGDSSNCGADPGYQYSFAFYSAAARCW